jgi:hypothetical protein
VSAIKNKAAAHEFKETLKEEEVLVASSGNCTLVHDMLELSASTNNTCQLKSNQKTQESFTFWLANTRAGTFPDPCRAD